MSNLREVDVCLKRIRELEAELAQWKAHGAKLDETYGDVKARAEKADAALADEKKRTATGDCVKCGGDYANVEDHISLAHMLRENAEARVAELEATLKETNTSAYDEAVAARQAREREAE